MTFPDDDPQPNDDTPAGWAWLGLLVLIVVLDVVLPRTLSQWTQGKSKKWLWFRVVGVLAFALLTWHLFWGFPGGSKPKAPPEPSAVECEYACY